MPKTTGLNGCLDETELEFVEREATPRLLMKLSVQLHPAVSRFRILSHFLRYSVSVALDQPFTTAFKRPLYSPNLAGLRTTLRLMKP